MIQNNEKSIGYPLPSVGEKEKQMKIDIRVDSKKDTIKFILL